MTVKAKEGGKGAGLLGAPASRAAVLGALTATVIAGCWISSIDVLAGRADRGTVICGAVAAFLGPAGPQSSIRTAGASGP